MRALNLGSKLQALGDIAKPFKKLRTTSSRLQQNFAAAKSEAAGLKRQLSEIGKLKKLREEMLQNGAALPCAISLIV